MTQNKDPYNNQVKIVEKILFEEQLTGTPDLNKTAKRIIAAIFCNQDPAKK